MPMSSEAVEAVYEQARIVIDPLPSDEPAAASTVEQARDKALSTLKASLEQEVTPARIRHRGRYRHRGGFRRRGRFRHRGR